jgi:molybdopterin converting factor small subunit
MSNVGEEILVELKRNRELVGIYKELPAGVGTFGAVMINQDIDRAEKALAEGDVVAILQAYEKLKGNE